MAVQGDLFGENGTGMPDLALVEDAVSPALEADLAAHIDACPLEPFKFGQWRGKRLTCNFGSGYDYQRGALADAPPIPHWLMELRDALAPQLGRDPEDFVQALVIRYDPGAGIGWHRDRPQYGEVIGLSLNAPATLRLRRRTEDGFARQAVQLPPRSAYLLTGEVRDGWEHSIAPMELTRRSITFRSLR